MRLLLFFLFGLASCSDASSIRSQTSEITGGQPDSTSAVVLVHYTSGATGGVCSASVIAPHVVLLAAHCVDPAIIGAAPTFRVFLGADYLSLTARNDPNNWVDVTQAIPNPGWNTHTFANDIALLVTATALPPTPLALPSRPLSNADVGSQVLMVGYGETVPGDASSAYIRTSAMGPIQSLTSMAMSVGTTSSTLCVGDSGGPSLLSEGGTNVVVGVHSNGLSTCLLPSTDTRVDAYLDDFILPALQTADPGFVAVDAGADSEGGAEPDATADGGSPGIQQGGCNLAARPSKTGSPSWLLLLLTVMARSFRRSS